MTPTFDFIAITEQHDQKGKILEGRKVEIKEKVIFDHPYTVACLASRTEQSAFIQYKQRSGTEKPRHKSSQLTKNPVAAQPTKAGSCTRSNKSVRERIDHAAKTIIEFYPRSKYSLLHSLH